MVPHVAKRGHSFIGAGKYYFHDKKAQTTERVAWVETVNLPTTDPAKAMKCMAWTSMNADTIRELAGGSRRGRKAVQGDVYPMSLSWEKDAAPTDAHMLETGLAALSELGMTSHQAVLLRHTDTEHDHLHIIVNLAHPETGVRAKISNDRLKLSEWAEVYEREHGIVCPQRVENNERRRNGEFVKHREARAEQAPTISQLYRTADSGKAFASAVQAGLGLTLAMGHKGRVVLVDEAGKVVNLARQLEGQRAKDIKAKLADLDLKKLPEAKTLSDERQQQEQRQQQQRPPVRLHKDGWLKGRFQSANDNRLLREGQTRQRRERELEAEIAVPMQRREAARASFAVAAQAMDAWQRQQAAEIDGERDRQEAKIRAEGSQWREIGEPMQRREALAVSFTHVRQEEPKPSPRVAIEDERDRAEAKLRTDKRKERLVDKQAELYSLRNAMTLRHLDRTREMEADHDRQSAEKKAALEPVYGRSIRRLESSIAAARERLEQGGTVYGLLFAWRDRQTIAGKTATLENARQREAEAWHPLKNEQRKERERVEKSQGDELRRMDEWIQDTLQEFERSLDPAHERDTTREQRQEHSQQQTRGDAGGGTGRSRSLTAQALARVKPLSRRRVPLRLTGRGRRRREWKYEMGLAGEVPKRGQRYVTDSKVKPRKGTSPRRAWTANARELVQVQRTPAPGSTIRHRPTPAPKPGF